MDTPIFFYIIIVVASITTDLKCRDVNFPGYSCAWHDDKKLAKQAAFCKQYEGYGDLCRCHDPFTPDLRLRQVRIWCIDTLIFSRTEYIKS